MRSLCVTLLLLSACSNQNVTEIQPPVADSVMIQVLIELHLAEARVDLFHESQTQHRDSILTKYQITQAEFEENMAFYRENPVTFHKLYSEALDHLSDERYLPADE